MNDDTKALICAALALPILWGFITAIFLLADTL
jgi:hypothetical protein